MALPAGTTLGPYEILSPLGAGAMGEVYRARDARLGREVAVKVVQAGAPNDADARRRFRGEALALSRLNHPNVATVFDFGTHEETDFLVMELIPGQSLAERLQAGALPEAELLPLALQLAEGLAAAHEGGVVHRDLKPANVRVTPEGRLKVLDFGLARQLETVTTDIELAPTMTVAGQAVATLAYMAPELFSGARADTRSDVYALGVVLYEMTTGRHPFPADTPIALLNAVANRSPAPPRSLRPEIPGGLDAIILQAMDRDPARRPASAREVLAALRQIGSGAVARPAARPPSRSTKSRVRSLAVLPLDNLSGDPGQDFFADGMTEALIADLAKIEGLRVISRTSAMRYRGARRPLPEIAAELGVDAIVEGSVSRSGARVRITAQLIHAATDTHLWADSFDRDRSDVLELQSEVARAVAGEIRIKLSSRSRARLTAARRVNPEAHDAYLRGRHFLNRRTEEALQKALACFRESIERDPAYALAHVGLGDVHNLFGYYSLRPPAETFPRAKAAVQRALEIDPGTSEAHASLAYAMHYYDWDWDGAEREYRKGIEQIPSYPQGHLWYLNLLSSRGRFDEAIEQASICRELDPLSGVIGGSEGWVRYFMRDYDGSIARFRAALELEPGFGAGHLWCSWPYIEKGMFDDAFRELETARTIFGDTMLVRLTSSYAHARAGRAAEARTILAQGEAAQARSYVPSYPMAMAYSALEEDARAWDWLERAVAERAHWLVFLMYDPRYDRFRSDPRFAGVRARVGV